MPALSPTKDGAIKKCREFLEYWADRSPSTLSNVVFKELCGCVEQH